MLIDEARLKREFDEVIHGKKNEDSSISGGFVLDISSLRSGKPNQDLVSKLKVDQYGAPSQIGYVAQVHVEGNSIVIKLFNPKDTELTKQIENAINSNPEIGAKAIVQEGLIRINFPPLTEESRKANVKVLKTKLEEFKIRARKVRQDARDDLKKKKEEGGVSEDDIKRDEEDVQKLLDKCIEELDKISSQKEEEIMTI